MTHGVKILSFCLVLVWNLMASQCVFCPEMRPAPASPHECCKPVGQAEGSLHQSQKPCPGHDTTFERHGKVQLTNPASLADMSFEMPVATPVALSTEPGYAPMTSGLAHPPPDLCLLHSVLLI